MLLRTRSTARTYVSLGGLLLASAAALLGLTACGEDAAKRKATQVAAKVNGTEISVHQLNALLAAIPNAQPETIEPLRRQLLDKLIDQQLAIDEAQKQKLERSPEVVMAVEMAKRDVIARAYLQRFSSAVPKVTDAEVHQYYLGNPAIFAERRAFEVQEISVEPQADAQGPLQDMAKAGKGADEIIAWLKNHQLQYRTSAATRTSDQIAAELLPVMSKLQRGETGFIAGPKNYLLIHVLNVSDAPLSEAEAKPTIGQYLQNVQVQKALQTETQRLRSMAKVQYLGDFAPTEAQTAPDNSTAKGTAGL